MLPKTKDHTGDGNLYLFRFPSVMKTQLDGSYETACNTVNNVTLYKIKCNG